MSKIKSTCVRSVFAVAIVSVGILSGPISVSAADLSVTYSVDKSFRKSVTATDNLTFTLYNDALCTNVVFSQDIAVNLLAIKRERNLHIKGTPRLPGSSALIRATLVGAPATDSAYLDVTGPGIVPVSTSCQVQASGIGGPAGATGPAGADGADGATGATGSAGADGADGATGATGSAGADGADGATGATGSAGADGATGATGATGSAGADGVSGHEVVVNAVPLVAGFNTVETQCPAGKRVLSGLISQSNGTDTFEFVRESITSTTTFNDTYKVLLVAPAATGNLHIGAVCATVN